MECSPHRAGHDLWSQRKADTACPAAGNGHTAVKLTLQELAYRGLAARFCRRCSNPPLKAKHAMPDKTTGAAAHIVIVCGFSGCVLLMGAPCFCFALNLPTHSFRLRFSSISSDRHSESNPRSPAGHYRRDSLTPISAPWSRPIHPRPRCSQWKCKTKKTVDSLPPGRHSYGLGTAAESGGQGLTGCVC